MSRVGSYLLLKSIIRAVHGARKTCSLAPNEVSEKFRRPISTRENRFDLRSRNSLLDCLEIPMRTILSIKMRYKTPPSTPQQQCEQRVTCVFTYYSLQ